MERGNSEARRQAFESMQGLKNDAANAEKDYASIRDANKRVYDMARDLNDQNTAARQMAADVGDTGDMRILTEETLQQQREGPYVSERADDAELAARAKMENAKGRLLDAYLEGKE